MIGSDCGRSAVLKFLSMNYLLILFRASLLSLSLIWLSCAFNNATDITTSLTCMWGLHDDVNQKSTVVDRTLCMACLNDTHRCIATVILTVIEILLLLKIVLI